MKEKPSFDDAGLVPSVDFPYDSLDPAEPEPPEVTRERSAELRQRAFLDVLRLLGRGATARKVGRRVILLAYLLRVSGIGTQRQLAKRLGVSPGRVSQGLKALRRELLNMGAGLDT